MHFATMLITKELPCLDDVYDYMKLYDEYNYDKYYKYYGSRGFYDDDKNCPIVPIDCPIRPLFYYDWLQIGGRYDGRIKLGIDYSKKEYEWDYIYTSERRNGRVFYSRLLDRTAPISDYQYFQESDYFGAMGANDGYINVDSAKIEDIKNMNDISCFYCVDTINHNVAMQEYYDFDREKFIKDDQFQEHLQKIKDQLKEGYLTILDIHD